MFPGRPPSVRCSLTHILCDTTSLYSGGISVRLGTKLSCERSLPKRFSRSEVTDEGHDQTK